MPSSASEMLCKENTLMIDAARRHAERGADQRVWSTPAFGRERHLDMSKIETGTSRSRPIRSRRARRSRIVAACLPKARNQGLNSQQCWRAAADIVADKRAFNQIMLNLV
jgi:hypothetical protein